MKTILVDAVYTFVSDAGEIYKPLQDLLDQYSNRKIILTGADYEVDNKYNLKNMPYEVFTLKHNPEKSDPQYFKTLLDKYSLKSDEVVYFEHADEAMKSAQSLGILTHFYDSDKKDLVALKQFLDANL
jgi:hypothetical protein